MKRFQTLSLAAALLLLAAGSAWASSDGAWNAWDWGGGNEGGDSWGWDQAGSGGDSWYASKTELPDRPFSEFCSPVKDIPLGLGLTFSLGGSAQYRFQSLDNRRDFSYDLNDEDASLLARERLNLTLRHQNDFRAFFEAQDAHEFWRDRLPGTNPGENALDVYQAYGEIGLLPDVLDQPSLAIKVGRQELALGHGHLFSNKDWLNTGQVFDLARVTWRPDGFQIDAFAGWPVVPDHRNPDTPSSHRNLAGLNLKALGIPRGHTVEGYAIYKWDDKRDFLGERGGRAGERLGTFGGRADGRFLRHFDYDLETAFQTGERGEDNVAAWLATGELGGNLRFETRSLRLALAYTQASGDKDPTDGNSQTFDPLFGDPFKFHGKLLLTGNRNIEDLRPRLQLRLWKGGLIEADLHFLHLQQAKDAFYNFDGKALRQNKSGQGGREAGRELDLQVTHVFHENMSVSGGAFLFYPGRFFRKTGNKGDDLTRNYFVMMRLSF